METLQGVELTGTNRPCGLITIIFTVSVVDGNPERVPTPSRDGALPAKPAGSPRGFGETLQGFRRGGADSRLRESRSKLGERARLGFDKRARGSRHQKVSGGNSGGATPDPISNSEVKSSRADGTAGETLWESRSPPGLFSRQEGIPFLPFLWCGLVLLVGPASQPSQFASKVLGDEVLQAVVRPV